MAKRKVQLPARNQNLTRLRLRQATSEAFDASRSKLRAAVMASEPGVYSAAELWDDLWWVETTDKFVAPVLWDAYMRAAFLTLPPNTETVPPWVLWSAETSWRAQVNRVRHLAVTVGKRVAVLADTGQGETRGWMLEQLGLVAAAGPLSAGIEDGVVLTEGDAADQGGLAAGAELQQGFKTWVAAGANTRPTHQDADGQVVGFDEMFVVGGEECEFPGDPALSDAEAINCQCETDYEMEDPRATALEEDWSVIAMAIDNVSLETIASLETAPLTAEELSQFFSPEQVQSILQAQGVEVVDGLVTGELKSLSDFADRELRAAWRSELGMPRDVRFVPTAPVRGIEVAATRVQAAVDEVVGAIEGLHGVPAGSPDVTFHVLSNAAEEGNFVRLLDNQTGDFLSYISIQDGTQNLNTVAHELGHYMDWADIGTASGGYGTGAWAAEAGLSGVSQELLPVMEALYATPEIESLIAMQAAAVEQGALVYDGVRLQGSRIAAHTEYLLRPREVFARAYAQFVAVESGNTAMLSELAAMQIPNPRMAMIKYVWSDAVFEPVQAAMREALRLAGVA